MKSYVQGGGKKSHRDAYTKKVQEQETLGKTLRDKQKAVKEAHEPNMRQADMWRDLTKLLDMKRLLTRQTAREQDPLVQDDEDRIVF